MIGRVSTSEINRAAETAQTVAPRAQRTQSDFGEVLASVSHRGQDLNPIFEQAANTYGVPKALLRAIAFHESGFEADAVSSAGAMGIMQLMPATAQTMEVGNPFDARENIFGGAKLLGQLFDQYDGDLKLTLAAYGAGSGAVAKYGGVPPYEETRGFVRDILSAVDENALDGASSERAASMTGQIRGFTDFSDDDYQDFLLYWKAMSSSVASVLNIGETDEKDDGRNLTPHFSWLRL